MSNFALEQRDDWTPHEKRLITFFNTHRKVFPQNPYTLELSGPEWTLHVGNPEAFYNSLADQIADGFDTERAMTGCLQRDLQALWDRFTHLKHKLS